MTSSRSGLDTEAALAASLAMTTVAVQELSDDDGEILLGSGRSPASRERDPTLMLARVEIDHEVSRFQVLWIRHACDPAVLRLVEAQPVNG
jgi:hypothetical protein